jgi:hypothetical protein
VAAGDLLVGLPGARVESAKGTVRLSLLSDLAQVSPYPVRESAVVLRENPSVDLDFILDRGRVDVTNLKKKGPAQVRVSFQTVTWDLTLSEPGTRVALELYGRRTGGIPFSAKAKPDPTPDTELVLLVLQGHVDLKSGTTQFGLSAPPGPAYYHWDSTRGADASPGRLDKLPIWANPEAGDQSRVRLLQAAIESLRKRLAAKPVEQALADAAASDNSVERRGAVFCYAALDSLGPVTDLLQDEKSLEVREAAILALRHWIGRGPAHDLKVYDVFVERHKYTRPQAEIVLQLLHTPSQEEQAQPELYEILIAYLTHPKLPVRELARWHLYGLVPAGKKIAYDAAAPEGQRKKAAQEWKQLIPDGKLPPRPKPGGN